MKNHSLPVLYFSQITIQPKPSEECITADNKKPLPPNGDKGFIPTITLQNYILFSTRRTIK